MGIEVQLDQIVRAQLGDPPRQGIRILDFGCGSGDLVTKFAALGYEAYGCDIGADWPEDEGVWKRPYPGESWRDDARNRLRVIETNPYRLPFDDHSFDAVVSTSVLEHAQNKEEIFRELARVLRPDGIGVHLVPAKFRIIEPHIFVPFASWMWPDVPMWWLSLWAILGVRNQFQGGLPWRTVARLNYDYCRNGVHYWRLSQYRAITGFVDLEPQRLACGTGRLVRLTRGLRVGWLILPLRARFSDSCIGHRSPV